MINQSSSNNPQSFLAGIDGVGHWLAPLGLRILLAWEFFEAGRAKLHGQNWFADLSDKFPLPFSLLSPGVNWTLAAWFELICSIALLVGVGTRFAAATLWVLTVVAIYAVHWPSEWSSLDELWQGYAISNEGFGNYKLPLLYLVMLLPLALGGAGRLSVDHLARKFHGSANKGSADAKTWGAVLLALGVTTALLLPWLGGSLAVAGLGLLVVFRPRVSASYHRSFA